MTDFEKIANAHRAEIVEDFVEPHGLHAECSCGWASTIATSESWVLAEHAGHVYVVAGLADLAADGGEYTP